MKRVFFEAVTGCTLVLSGLGAACSPSSTDGSEADAGTPSASTDAGTPSTAADGENQGTTGTTDGGVSTETNMAFTFKKGSDPAFTASLTKCTKDNGALVLMYKKESANTYFATVVCEPKPGKIGDKVNFTLNFRNTFVGTHTLPLASGSRDLFSMAYNGAAFITGNSTNATGTMTLESFDMATGIFSLTIDATTVNGDATGTVKGSLVGTLRDCTGQESCYL